MPIDTHLDATPSDITASATAIGNIKSHVDSTEDDLISARKSVCELEGSSAMAASGSISTSVADCESLVSNLESYKTALDNLASALSSVKTDLQGIRDQATAGGLLLNGETVYDPATVMAAPADGGGGAGGGSDSDAAAKTALYKNLETQASDIRLRETEARQAFADACNAITDITNPVAKTVVGVVVPNTKGGGARAAVNVAKWAIGRASNAASLTRALALRKTNARVTTELGNGKVRTSHKAVDGRTVGRTRSAIHDGDLGNWKPGAGAEDSTAAKVASGAGRVGKVLKVAGVVGDVASGGVEAYDQWKKDSHDPSLGDREKVTRAAATGLGTAGGAWAGGALGAKVGAGIGACLGGPVGAAVGGIAGGIIGGAAGSAAGKAIADGAKGLLHKMLH
ncbi:hypothetical protein [Actinomyces massiliensis]|uniref:hypothetical protein n=1 Tax=Actinomyces massiliensis TaxID=461393 RepID=UPI0028E9114B|nr:hypothetical protein [Actinomyces massiliensis]